MVLEQGDPAGPVVSLVSTFRAPVDKVYAAWTTPEILREWFFAEAGFETRDVAVALEPLGAYQIVVAPTDGGEPTRIRGHFVDIDPGRSLVYTWTGACADEQYWTLVTVRFEPGEAGEGARLTLDHGVFRTDADRVMHEQGWLACIASLGGLLEGEL
jgi:uncharacterized protein YndB with AHSA1/START domain